MEELKMINSKKMVMEQLENVAGGTYLQSYEVANILTKVGFKGLLDGAKVNLKELRSAVNALGFRCNDHGGIVTQNTYVNKATNKVYSQEEFKVALQIKFPGVKIA